MLANAMEFVEMNGRRTHTHTHTHQRTSMHQRTRNTYCGTALLGTLHAPLTCLTSSMRPHTYRAFSPQINGLHASDVVGWHLKSQMTASNQGGPTPS